MHQPEQEVRGELGRTGEAHVREALEDHRQHHLGLHAGQVDAEAQVRPGPEVPRSGEVGAQEVELIGALEGRRVATGGARQ